MQINDLSARIKANEQAITGAIQRVVASGWLVLGPEVKQFESAFAQYLGTEHCISVANGTDAIELALRSFGVGPGDRVATVANASMYTATAAQAIGAQPFFLDVDPDTRNITLIEVERAIAAGVRFVVATHLYGLAAPEILQIAQRCADSGVKLLEDCAQAHGARVDGRMVGTFGDAASFSFYPTKNLGALGDGGAVTTRHADIAERIRRLRQYGWTDKYKVEFAGARNTRLDEMQAAVLSAFLPGLDAGNERRREIAARYNAGIRHPQIQLPVAAGPEYVGHLYVLRSAQRDSLRQHLRAEGIASDIHYPIPDHRQPVFGDLYADVHLPNTERLATEILTLPCYPEMTDAQVDQVVASVNSWRP
ncbi:DegT/DnrJ/EryC1/StrS family aminotransferase [Lysobacter enzymogenes]|uniref:DegT/DnrJ/EryC1/StrS family aminotransferase n=1 Tax=Lysobacter enzymogenes TaxID=69 RepID=UPI001A970D37|nr:DegT/DnrJ/EryC1/StrS family aminotransferase [Lysobacter enzymogenes]QQP98609.1 DegT/DnrJ/EryC1/StrS family aminotransferase [Lysobacter enzymogenes]